MNDHCGTRTRRGNGKVLAWIRLGISRTTIVVTFAILLGGVVIAAAFAIGLGARDLARDLLQSQFRPKVRPEAEDPLRHR